MPDDETVPNEFAPEEPAAAAAEVPESDEASSIDEISLDVDLKLSEEQKKEIVSYLEDVLPNMKPSDDDTKKVRTLIAMYEMAAKQRNFPYENAPSLASSDMHNALNDWLDVAETAFLDQKVTFTIDREETTLPEEAIRRIENTFHKEFFIKKESKDFRLKLFEAGLFGGCIVNVRDEYRLEPRRIKIVIRDDADLKAEMEKLSDEQISKAQETLSKGKIYVTEHDTLNIVNSGPKIRRCNYTKFWFPRNAYCEDEWQIVSEQESYTKSALKKMVEMGELDRDEVKKAIETRRSNYQDHLSKEKETKLTEKPKPSVLDVDWTQDIGTIKEMGDAYEDQFNVYRVTMLYNVATKDDPGAAIPAWIQVLFCPAGRNLLGARFCQNGFPYRIIKFQPVSYKSVGVGIGQQRFNYNLLDTDLKSYFLAAIEQELGASLLIRDGSNLFATAFRAFPGSVAYTMDPERDVKFLQVPDKSKLAVQGMSMVLGSSPTQNAGVGYASGKREEIMQQQDMLKKKARIRSIALDFDEVINMCWQMFVRLYKMNTRDAKVVPWVYKNAPINTRLYVLEDEMKEKIVWSSVASAVTLTPDARLMEAMRQKEIFHDKVPASVNSPKMTVNWLDYMAGFFSNMDDQLKKKLLPSLEDFQSFQSQLGAQGAEQGGKPPATPMQAQSPATPFRNPVAQK